MISSIPRAYLIIMCLAGLLFSQIVRLHPEVNNGPVSPLVWLIGVALLYELVQKMLPAARLQPLEPMQRFLGFFAGAILFLLLRQLA